MGPNKIKKMIPSNNLINTQAIQIHIENLLSNSQDGIVAFDAEGKIIAMSEKATQFFGKSRKKLIDQYLWYHLKLDTFARKRQFIHARQLVALANAGVAQEMTWIELNRAQKPLHAYQVIISKTEIQDNSLFFAKITDILAEKITEWVLWSLAKITSHDDLGGIIDEVLKLASDVFAADYALVGLIDNQKMLRSVSYYQSGKKIENINYPLLHSPAEKIVDKKSIQLFHHLNEQFPEDSLLADMEMDSFLGGPIINAQENVVGLMYLMKKEDFEVTKLYNALFRLFLGRVNIEIERLINHRKLQFLASIPQQDPNPIMRILPGGDIIFANNQGKVILQSWMDRYSALPETILVEARKAQLTNQVVRIEMESDNKTYLFTLVWIPDFNQINIYGTDISQLKSTEQTMISLARFDALTQIANRQYFEETLLQKIQDHLQEGKELALLLIDLDDFKVINDTLGHPIGDMLLKAATKRMVRCLRKDDFIARLGGDEFIVLLNNSNTSSTVMVAEKMISVLARSFQFGEYRMKITASIGIAFYPKDGLTISELLKHSDIAMYQSKKDGKNNYTIFSKYLHIMQDKRNEVIRKELKQAASKNELYVDYQPIFEVGTKKIVGLEALLRWVHPKQGLILPNEFISIAEQTGSIHLISQWLIEQSLHDFSTLSNLDSKVKLSINVSLSQLNDARFLDTFCDSLVQTHLNKERIVLDISERIIAPHFQQMSKNLRKIHMLGLKIGLDNFGSPQVSLPKLLALPIDYLKLDQLLLLGTEKSTKHRMLLKGIINLTKDMQLNVIQKGIETKEQDDLLSVLGCPYAQGYYYCKPLKIDELREFIKNYPH